MFTLSVITLIFFFDKIDLSGEELYQEYVIDRAEEYDWTVKPSETEIFVLSVIFRMVIFAVLPTTALIYRSKLLSMKAFKEIKMHQGRRKGVAYSQYIEVMNNFFLWSKLKDLNYIEYVTYR
jgi:hypothetical protein